MTKSLLLSRWLKWVLGLGIVCLYLVLPPQGVALPPRSLNIFAQTSSVQDLQRQQQQLQQERSRLDQEQNRLLNLQQTAETRLDGLKDTIQVTASQIADNEKQLTLANQRLQTLQAELDKAEQHYQGRQSATIARLRFLQRQQGSKGWAVLLHSQNLNEFLDRRHQLKLVYEADRKILTALQQESIELEQRHRTVAQQKNEVALLTQQLQAQKAQYEAQAQTQAVLIDRLRADRQSLEAAETQLEKDSANIAELIRQRIASADRSRIVVRGTGRFSYPSGGRLSSGFGYRIHPILGYRRFHAGVDFAASHGSTIRVADAGQVIFSGWYGGYGRSVIVDHGDNLTTLYAHASEVFVSEGQSVQQGQAIAAVGSTGLSTGPHLHFEVRRHGAPVDPMGYL